MSDEKPDYSGANSSSSQRLQSLSTRGGLGGLRGGRFLPNAVGRRSEEERKCSAPALKPQTSAQDDTNKLINRGKLDRRKQRQLGTRAEAAGPLAAPTIASSASTARMARQLGSISAAEPSYSTKEAPVVKSEPESTIVASVANDFRIDMSSAKDSFIPLRMPTASSKAEILELDSDQNDLSQDKTEAPGHVKSALQCESAHDFLDLNEGDLFLVQLPRLSLVTGKAPSTPVLHHSKPKAAKPDKVKIKSETAEHVPHGNGAQSDVAMEELTEEPKFGAAGRLGTLRRHASGRHTMVIGSSVYEVIKGTHGASLEELVVLNEEFRHAYPLGGVKSRLLVIPDLDSLNI